MLTHLRHLIGSSVDLSLYILDVLTLAAGTLDRNALAACVRFQTVQEGKMQKGGNECRRAAELLHDFFDVALAALADGVAAARGGVGGLHELGAEIFADEFAGDGFVENGVL